MKKGFTLIELLAVIVILAIIALIATPIILNVIENAKLGASESSGLGYVDAVEKQTMINEVDKTKSSITDNTYTVSELDGYSVKVKGDKPSSDSWVTIEKGQVTACSLKIKDYIVNCEGKSKVTGEKGSTLVTKPSGVTHPLSAGLTKGTAVYMNPETANVCTESDYIANTNSSNTGNKLGCMKWYVYKDNGNGTYQLILDHNTTGTVRWSTTSTNDTNGDAVKAQLATDISGWHTSLKTNNARLITADEVAEITNNTTFNGATSTTSSNFYFDTNTTSQSTTCKSGNISGCQYGWLYDRTYTSCTTYGCLNNSDTTTYGYWTSTAVSGVTNIAWFVNSGGILNYDYVDDGVDSGVRPVVTF